LAGSFMHTKYANLLGLFGSSSDSYHIVLSIFHCLRCIHISEVGRSPLLRAGYHYTNRPASLAVGLVPTVRIESKTF
jgi:hypothetical protein